ncbi:MAG: SDR family NAD(P)-dependent oxidoreductase [Promethearchaeota archaeon]|jgi:NAD(P)-dependent dehydrogenase (short-subunit alcohol dehydrogenase family)
MGKLDGKVALITGAAAGIGKATSKLFVSEGVKGVVMADILDDMGEKVAEELGQNAIYTHADVSQENDIKKAIDLAVDKFGRLDIVFSNAGNPGPGGAIEDVPVDEFDYTVAVHLRAAFLCMKYSIPIMKKQGTGCFITTSSVAAYQHGMGTLPYSLSKAGIIQLTRIAAVELGIYGIRANAIAPGGIATGIFGQSAGVSREGSEKMAVLMKEILGDMQAIRRAGLPEDIANAALFLASDSSSFITGITLLVDGGMLSGRIPQYPEENQAKWAGMMQELDPDDQKILTQRAQEGFMKMMEDLKYVKPEIREKIMKRMQKMAAGRTEG